jgi:hypothetical protein
MKIAVTVRSDDFGSLTNLLDQVRANHSDMTILEAPNGLTYPYAFPVVAVSSPAGWDRHFGSEAIEVLKDVAKAK